MTLDELVFIPPFFRGRDALKNKFYLFILFASLAVCGTVVFRPRVADRVFGLLGLRHEAVSPYISPELEGNADTSSDTVTAFDEDTDDNSDGYAVTGLQPIPPHFGDDLPHRPAFGNDKASEPAFDGFTNSGHIAAASPEFGFAGYNQPVVDSSNHTNIPQPEVGVIEINFANNSPTGTTSHATQSGNTAPEIQFGFAPAHSTGNNVSLSMPPNQDTGFAVSGGSSNTQQASRADFDHTTAISNASFITPDNRQDDGFADYRIPDKENETIVSGNATTTPRDVMSVTYDQAVNQTAPQQTTQPALPPMAGIQPVPVVASPQLSPHETPLYIPPQGNTGQIPLSGQTQQFASSASAPGVSVPIMSIPSMSTPSMSTPSMSMPPQAPVNPMSDYGQVPQNAVASVAQPPHSATPTLNSTATTVPFNDQRSQYEPEIISEIETVFATDMLAKVGSKNVIMACDILAETRENIHNIWVQEYRKAFEEYGERATVADERNFKAEGMQIMFEQTLNGWIELQMLYLDLMINFPAEQLEAVKNEELKNFDMTELPRMMEQYGVTNRYDLDMELRKFGTTLERKRVVTVEKRLAQVWFGQIAKTQDSSLTPSDMRAYYEQHKEEKYKKTGYAKWEELAILFSEVPNVQEASAKIAALGNRVRQGEEFAEVARNGSQGLTSHRGGEREAEVGTLSTQTLEQAVYSLPIGQMSRIFREDSGPFAGLYIVRVQERQQTRYTPFDSVQNEIQKSINEERIAKEQERVLAELRKKYLVEVSPYLQQVVAMAVEAERKRPIVDTPERHEKQLALARRLDPPKKEHAPRQQNQTAVAMAPQRSQGQAPTQTNVTETPNTPPINRPDSRSGNRDSTWEPGLGTTIDKKGEETRKENAKDSFWNAIINTFR